MSSHEEIFFRLLDESAARLVASDGIGITIPDDELHREIIVPLLPAMLGDKSIRQHWSEQAATGFPARLARHLDGGDPAPRWLPDDFEIHVTASYSAGADARALADTLLSEDSLRDMTAALMNQLLDVLWTSLATAPSAVPVEPPAKSEISAPVMPAEKEPEPVRTGDLAPVEIFAASETPSRALVRALCGKLSASAVQHGFTALGAWELSAAVLARRIRQRAEAAKNSKPTSRRRLPRRASL